MATPAVTSLWWVLAIQVALAGAAVLSSSWIARQPDAVWRSVVIGSLLVLLAWPLVRFFPVPAIRLLGAPVVACIELTGLFIPATLLLGVAARHVPKPADRRALLLLIGVAGLYFVIAGKWMLQPTIGSFGGSGPPKMRGTVCLQSTDYTCVAASMVTMLRARGIEATEVQMARLSRTEIRRGATDSRALWALQTLLKDTPLRPVYASGGYDDLVRAPKPCLVQIDFGFFVSHMVPVMSADADGVVIGDPLSGEKRMSRAEFEREWKGALIALEPRGP
ncbi:MAG: hypothetical protein K2Q20_10910 [Phycisphaerales bacterium]|nr:hypothetical protein [Phycisphaerales bacterium]